MMTHFTVAAERGLSNTSTTADEAAPIHFLRKDTPPILLLLGDRDWPARLEENRYFAAALQKVGKNPNVDLHVIADRDHGTVLTKIAEPGDPAEKLIQEFMTTGKLPSGAVSQTPASD